MPKEKSKSGILNWPPEKTVKYSLTEREKDIESGEYIEIPVISEKERPEETR